MSDIEGGKSGKECSKFDPHGSFLSWGRDLRLKEDDCDDKNRVLCIGKLCLWIKLWLIITAIEDTGL